MKWPEVTEEKHPWTSRIPDDLVSRSVRERHAGPYRSAVTPAIAHIEIELPSRTLALADEASTEIVRFDAELGTDVAPFAAILLRSESASSSRIENLTSSARAIALAELGNDNRQNAAEIVSNVHAMKAAIELSDRIDESAILAMHSALLIDHQPEIVGRWRDQQGWIGGNDYGPHQAAFVPPHQDRVPAAMADLIEFAQRDDIPVLVHAALIHAQFETVHPFPDGNGRTGRALIHAILRRRGLTRNVTIPVSAGLLTDTNGYFDALTAYRSGEPEVIVTLMAEATFTAITNGRLLVRDLKGARERWSEKIEARRDAVIWRIMDLLLRQPVVDTALVERELDVTPANAGRALLQLTSAGVTKEFSDKKRNRMWQAPEVLSALDEFAARAGRRG
ncbi:Fic family protein [Kribbella albertanoniae]|uniref:Fic family protein n=2 Tax=Kribbella albertanoniae TaxID=1266829 RepID=A0A4R4NZ22_9ACTN|nr:Fic family protein [Kribbella albertanoniae]